MTITDEMVEAFLTGWYVGERPDDQMGEVFVIAARRAARLGLEAALALMPKEKTEAQIKWKVGDWVIFDLKVGQIKKFSKDSWEIFSDGHCEASGRLADRFRPLTLRNKRTVEWFDAQYGYLRQIDGEAGFNYPRIHDYFCELSILAIDGADDDQAPYDAARDFIHRARHYQPLIQGVRLFRSK